jgi:glycosyltransferase involved in cell wall biosynthesis
MRLAYFVFPHLGGTFTVYRLLRRGLEAMGVELRWLGAGPAAHRALAEPAWAGERSFGRVVSTPECSDDRRLALALARAVEEGGYEGVFVNVLTSRAEMSAGRYLRDEILRFMIVHSITPGTYAAARALRGHMHATVAVSPRIRNDLVHRFGFPAERCVVIGHGLDALAMPDVSAARPANGELRLVYLGRVEDTAKGVFWLPRILVRLPDTVTLTIAGEGPDLAILQQRCAGLGDRVHFVGPVSPARVSAILSQHDVLIAPSRYEGFCLTVVEAMAAGCIPVVSRISGVTDIAIEDGHSGLLFPVGDVRRAALAIVKLADPALRRAMSANARARARARFSAERMAEQYLKLVCAIRGVPPPVTPQLDPNRWDIPRGLRPGLRTFLPEPLKNFLRTVRERAAA